MSVDEIVIHDNRKFLYLKLMLLFRTIEVLTHTRTTGNSFVDILF